MKIINSINQSYENQLLLNQLLEKKVKNIFLVNKQKTWHYFDRIKSKESFASKIETGRVRNHLKLDDFFACTLVVENSLMITKVRKLINQFFNIIEQKPHSESFTHNAPESFEFDDLRLYVKLKRNTALPETHPSNKLSNILFEIQIKTFLQHAWIIATHDLIYKGNEISWAKRRIAYQIKAMLENAELSILEIEKIKESEILKKINKDIINQNKIKKFLIKNWKSEQLPIDLVRLSKNTSDLLVTMDLSLNDLKNMLDEESKIGKGKHTLDLPPYFVMLQTIINQNPSKFTTFLSLSSVKGKIAIPPEINNNGLKIKGNNIIII